MTRHAHHADAAGDQKAVLRWAPVAAEQAAQTGAHHEAAAQYARALRFADGPHGQIAASDAGGCVVDTGRFVIVPLPHMNETLIGIKRPAGGRWTIAPQPGAPPIVVVSHANGLPAARITASVHGHRRARELAYRIRPRAGEAVTFAERAGQVFHVIGTSRRSSGTLRFSPAVAPALRGACASAAAGPSSRPPGVPLPTPMAMP